MPTLLLIETATAVCSVALANNDGVLAELHTLQPNAHSSQLSPYIAQLYEQCRITPSQLDGVCISSGPGSYTGLRIGVSTAKGVCYAADRPMLAVDTLHAMAYGMLNRLGSEVKADDLFIPMIDARRMEVYCAVYDAQMNLVKDTEALVVEKDSFAALGQHRLWLFGDGAAKLAPLFADQPHIQIVEDLLPSAAFMAVLADQDLKAHRFVDVAYFEPFYLKDFVAGKPHVKGL